VNFYNGKETLAIPAAAVSVAGLAVGGLTIGSVMTGDVAEDLLQRLAMYSARLGREVEVLLRADGSGEVMAAEEDLPRLFGDEVDARSDVLDRGFTAVACFDSIAELQRLLEAE
jgi:hypothetical protein